MTMTPLLNSPNPRNEDASDSDNLNSAKQINHKSSSRQTKRAPKIRSPFPASENDTGQGMMAPTSGLKSTAQERPPRGVVASDIG
jgi:hypothetical protein